MFAYWNVIIAGFPNPDCVCRGMYFSYSFLQHDPITYYDNKVALEKVHLGSSLWVFLWILTIVNHLFHWYKSYTNVKLAHDQIQFSQL